jgi:hypothetical protein
MVDGKTNQTSTGCIPDKGAMDSSSSRRVVALARSLVDFDPLSFSID